MPTEGARHEGQRSARLIWRYRCGVATGVGVDPFGGRWLDAEPAALLELRVFGQSMAAIMAATASLTATRAGAR